MEILYLWIRKYKSIYNQGFNFGGDMLFRYEDGYLEVERNVMCIPGFFNIFPELGRDSPDILNVTGIAGENGTGKTNFLDYIKYLSTQNKEDYILCYKNNDGGYYITGAECKLGKSPVDIIRIKSNDFFSSSRFIYLSNILDITRSEQSSSQLFNISTNFLINQEGFEQFRASEFLRQITFSIDRNFSSLIDFKLPEKVNCSILTEQSSGFSKELRSWSVDTMDQNQYDNQNSNFDKSIITIRKIRGVFQELLKKQKLYTVYNQFISNIIIVFLSEILDLPKKLSEYLINQISMFNDLIDYIIVCLRDQNDAEVRQLEFYTIKAINGIQDSLADIFFDINTNSERERTTLRNVIEKWTRVTYFKIQTIEYFTNVFQEDGTSYYGNTHLKISSNGNSLRGLITNYLKSFMKKGYLHFEWLELSAGQVARLNIYSRLYYAMSKIPKQLKDVVIIIDEGELYFHPEWQRKWLWYFLRAVSSLFINKRVQIIISTHSPFILSDLPSHNVIFLKKGEKGLQVIEGLDDNQLTFASNINTLLSNSFFMKNGLVGEVAKLKINKLISMLNNKDQGEIRKDEENIAKQLRYIGEPIIRNKLFSMLNNILTVDYLQVQNRLDEIEERLNNRGL
ncbi:AAA family ATPase [Heyndrickxia oleronia]|uniref:AAA family ATPase n=1 Tax=Heyndrickxia oleronia TaxID=38875 RepID=UPI001B00E3B0|nr:AAA family ATPase [Heyndrickxia oleronia]GIN41191.1 hypothetical protein J19TS1_41400 [Heyndrickxia oleronia]